MAFPLRIRSSRRRASAASLASLTLGDSIPHIFLTIPIPKEKKRPRATQTTATMITIWLFQSTSVPSQYGFLVVGRGVVAPNFQVDVGTGFAPCFRFGVSRPGTVTWYTFSVVVVEVVDVFLVVGFMPVLLVVFFVVVLAELVDLDVIPVFLEVVVFGFVVVRGSGGGVGWGGFVTLLVVLGVVRLVGFGVEIVVSGSSTSTTRPSR